jgi:hypothetical protein
MMRNPARDEKVFKRIDRAIIDEKRSDKMWLRQLPQRAIADRRVIV